MLKSTAAKAGVSKAKSMSAPANGRKHTAVSSQGRARGQRAIVQDPPEVREEVQDQLAHIPGYGVEQRIYDDIGIDDLPAGQPYGHHPPANANGPYGQDINYFGAVEGRLPNHLPVQAAALNDQGPRVIQPPPIFQHQGPIIGLPRLPQDFAREMVTWHAGEIKLHCEQPQPDFDIIAWNANEILHHASQLPMRAQLQGYARMMLQVVETHDEVQEQAVPRMTIGERLDRLELNVFWLKAHLNRRVHHGGLHLHGQAEGFD